MTLDCITSNGFCKAFIKLALIGCYMIFVDVVQLIIVIGFWTFWYCLSLCNFNWCGDPWCLGNCVSRWVILAVVFPIRPLTISPGPYSFMQCAFHFHIMLLCLLSQHFYPSQYLISFFFFYVKNSFHSCFFRTFSESWWNMWPKFYFLVT